MQAALSMFEHAFLSRIRLIEPELCVASRTYVVVIQFQTIEESSAAVPGVKSKRQLEKTKSKMIKGICR